MRYYNVLAGSKYYQGSETLTYSSYTTLKTGSVVSISLRNRETLGIVTSSTAKPRFAVKPITALLTEGILPIASLRLLNWVSKYYPSGAGPLVSLFLPSYIKIDAKPTESQVKTKPGLHAKTSKLPPLTSAQKKTLENIDKTLAATSVLLHGDTGSGKTRIYVELAKRCIDDNRSVVMLTPEIGLTSQLANVFKNCFSDKVLLFHSELTNKQRREVWLQSLSVKSPLIVIGPRSALFLPIRDIGLIMLDEAHEQSYKQDQAPRYNTLRVAGAMARIHKSRLILGSATPNITEYYQFESLGLPIVDMKGKALAGAATTNKFIVISKRDRDSFTKSKLLSDELNKNVEKALSANEQSLIFLNRRGTAKIVLCNECGWQALCPNCDLPLTYHGDKHTIVCHSCGYKDKAPVDCPVCSSVDIAYSSPGTKAVETELKRLFPGAKIMRFDTDNKKSESLEQNISNVISGTVDILVGTQILGKGLDLPRLSVVGVLSADTNLSFPDYTSQEMTFQMLHQITGRTGRGHLPGTAVVQTMNPTNPAINYALSGDWNSFYEWQIQERRKYNFPPFCHLMKLTTSGKNLTNVKRKAANLAKELTDNKGLVVEGPMPSFYEKRRGQYTWQLVLKSSERKQLLYVINGLPSGWQHDIDPSNLL